MYRLCCIALCALACASPPAPRPGGQAAAAAPAAASEVPSQLVTLLERLEAMEIGFMDPATLETYRATGPYRVVSWERGELRLVGHDADGLGAAHLDLRTSAEATWLLARIRDQEFLLRME